MIIGLKAHANADAEDSYHSQWCSDSIVAYSTPGKDSLGVEIANLYNMDYQDFWARSYCSSSVRRRRTRQP